MSLTSEQLRLVLQLARDHERGAVLMFLESCISTARNGDEQMARGCLSIIAECLRRGIALSEPMKAFAADAMAFAGEGRKVAAALAGADGKPGTKAGQNMKRDALIVARFRYLRGENIGYNEAIRSIANDISRSPEAVRTVVDKHLALERRAEDLWQAWCEQQGLKPVDRAG